VRKYLERYAAEEARLAGALPGQYDHALVVPIRGERSSFLEGYEAALSNGLGRTLVVVVSNTSALAPEGPEEAACREELMLLFGAPQGELSENVRWWRRATHDVVVIDRASPGLELPDKGGVGHARKIGTDFALQLWALGKLSSPWVHMTDADARLPASYFRASADADAVAMVYPFFHDVCEDSSLGDSHALYEISLRHYVLGLRGAGSPYAFHSIGSCIAVRAPALAAVRGVPKRQAGEDFYFLDKLAKVGRIIEPEFTGDAGNVHEPIVLAPRRSARAPFGTGPAVNEIMSLADWDDYAIYDSRCFDVLSAWLSVLDECAESRSTEPIDRWLASLEEPLSTAVGAYLTTQRTAAAVSSALHAAQAVSTVRRRLHTWFDGLRTLRFVHAVRDASFPKTAWRGALARASRVRVPTAGAIAEICGELRALDVGCASPLGESRLGHSRPVR